MTEVLGVGISLAKSIVSQKGLEFAKVLIRNGRNVSAIPLKQMAAVSVYPTLLPMF